MFQEQEWVSVEIKEKGIRFQGEVQCVRENFLVLSCSPADARNCPPGTPICILQATGGALYLYHTEVARSQGTNIIVPRLTPQVIQRRRGERVACDLESRYLWLTPRAEGSKVVAAKEQAARICDLSVGGARCHSSEALFANTTLRLRICLDGKEWITTEATVLRCAPRLPESADALDYPFEISFRFTAMKRTDHLILTRMVQQWLALP